MDEMKKWVDSAVSWKFLNEPFWRWVVFSIALGGALAAWRGVLRHMDD